MSDGTARKERRALGNRVTRKQARRKADRIRAGTFKQNLVVAQMPRKKK